MADTNSTKNILAHLDDIELPVQQPWLNWIISGDKTVEGRAAPVGRWAQYIGYMICITEKKGGELQAHAIIKDVRHYNTLDEYLEVEWKQAAPQCDTLKEAKDAYSQVMYTDAKDKIVQVFSDDRISKRGGIEAIELQVFH